MTRLSLLIGLTVLLLSAAVASDDDAAARQTPPDGYTLVWADEFDQPGRPDPTHWDFEHGFVRNNELQWYQPENATVKDGCLVIEARRERVANPGYDAQSRDWRRQRPHADYTSASLTTRGKQTWRYGRFEMRAKLDTRLGMWPAWWTLGVGDGRTPWHWPACGEIDIMEYFTGDLLANACWAKTGRGQNWDAVRKPLRDFDDPNWADKFHIWRMDWMEDAILLYVDGELMNTVALNHTLNPDGANPFRTPHFMIVNLALGGVRGGDPSQTEFPGRYEIDYIRVYQKAN